MKNRVKLSKTPFVCPVCGEKLQASAKACPECGSCELSGWNAQAGPDGLDLPGDDFDYDAFVAEEFGPGRKISRKERFIQVVAVVLLLALALLLVFRR